MHIHCSIPFLQESAAVGAGRLRSTSAQAALGEA